MTSATFTRSASSGARGPGLPDRGDRQAAGALAGPRSRERRRQDPGARPCGGAQAQGEGAGRHAALPRASRRQLPRRRPARLPDPRRFRGEGVTNIRFRTIVTGGPGAYLRPVLLTRLIRFLTILALAFSPLATFVAAPASATVHHAAMAASNHQMSGDEMPGHDMAGSASMAAMSLCKDMGETPKDQPCGSSDGDCVKACAAVPAIPAVGGDLEPQAVSHGRQLLPALVSVPHGLVPEAATPPPRGLLKI